MLDDQEKPIVAPKCGRHYMEENTDFTLWMPFLDAGYPAPGGRPVGKTLIGHQRMMSQVHKENEITAVKNFKF